MPHASQDSGSNGHCQYPAQNSIAAECLLSLKSDNFASIIGIDHCLALVAALTVRRSVMERKKDLESLGTMCVAACNDACVKA